MTDDVSIEITPTEPLFDEEIRVEISGVPPRRAVDVTTEMSLHGTRWRGHATFEADANGRVDLTEQAPIDGCYEGVRPMGLFQFMERVGEADSDDPWLPTVDVTVEGPDVEARRTIQRQVKTPGVTVSTVDHDDLVGTYYEPDGERPASPVLVLGGGESSESDRVFAPLLASRGHPTLELSYFGEDGLPNDLAEIPVEYLQTAGAWLLDRPSVRDDTLDVLGKGRGADLALFLGAHADEVRTVVAYNGSALLWQGVPSGLHEPGSMLTHDGEPLPCVRSDFGVRFLLGAVRCWVTRNPISLRPIYEKGLENAQDDVIKQATIPVEETQGPVLQITGGDDRTRNSPELASLVEERLGSEEFEHDHDHRLYDSAGYDIRPPYYPTTERQSGEMVLPGLVADFGGSPDGYARADADAWTAVREYLARDAESNPGT